MATVFDYYHRLESRTGYRLLLGGTRHFGLYETGTWWPFPIGAALRRMEEKLYQTLGLKGDALLLDGGAGTCEVAIYMAERGLRVKAIDLLDLHVGWGKHNVKARGQEMRVEVQTMDYQELAFDDATFDGAYTMETLVHARDSDQAIREFYRVLKPGGVMVHIEYEQKVAGNASAMRKLARINANTHMPAFTQFAYNTIQEKLENNGFRDVEVQDLSSQCLPMLRLFFVLAIIPYIFIRILGLEATFTNTMAAVDFYRIHDHMRLVMVRARKPAKTDGDFSGYQQSRRRADPRSWALPEAMSFQRDVTRTE